MDKMTNKVTVVVIMLGLLLSKAGHADYPQLDSSRVATGEFEYRTILQVGDTRLDIDSVRDIRVGNAASSQTLQINTITETDMGTTEDRLKLDFETLMPIERVVRQGEGEMKIDYHREQVTGHIQAAGHTVTVDLALDVPAYAGESGLEAVLTAMPLASGLEFEMRILEIDVETRVRLFQVSVGEQETIEVPAGRFSVWPIHLSATDEFDDEQTIWISDASPRVFVQAAAPIPADLGDGSLTTFLVSTSE